MKRYMMMAAVACSLAFAGSSARANSLTITVVRGEVRVTPPMTHGQVGIDFDARPPKLVNTLRVDPPKVEVIPPKFNVRIVIDPLIEVTAPRIEGRPPQVTPAGNGGFSIDFGGLTVIPGSVRLTPEGERLLKDASAKGKAARAEAQKKLDSAKAAAQAMLDRAKADMERAIATLKNDVETKTGQVKEQWNRMLQDVQARIKAKADELANFLRNLPPRP